MNKKLQLAFLVFTAFLIQTTAIAQFGPPQAYKFQIDHVFNGMPIASERVQVTSTIQVPDGYLILGNIERLNPNGDMANKIIMAHVDHHGEIPNSNFWIKEYGDDVTNQLGHQIIRDYLGNYVVLAEEMDQYLTPSRRILLYNVDLSGNISNVKTYNFFKPGNFGYCSTRGIEIIPTLGPNGPSGYAICGARFECTIQSDYPFVIRLDNNFNLTWQKIYPVANGKFLSIAQLHGLGQNFIAVGTNGDGIMAEIDYATGNLVVNANINNSGNLYSTGVRSFNKVISTSDGGFVLGSSIGLYSTSSGIPSEIGLHKFDQTRTRVWFSEYVNLNYNNNVLLEDIKETSLGYDVLHSSENGLIMTRIDPLNGDPVFSKKFTTGSTSSSFARFPETSVNYQKIHFSPGSIINEGTAFAAHFSHVTNLGGHPNTNERKEFRLIKMDSQFEAGSSNCQLPVIIAKDPFCTLQLFGPCRQLYANYGMLASISEGMIASTVPWGLSNLSDTTHYQCAEVVYEVSIPDDQDDGDVQTPFFKTTTGIDATANQEVEFTLKTLQISGLYELESSVEIERVQALDLSGKVVLDKTDRVQEVDLREYQGGVYLIRAFMNSGEVITSKVIKQ
ncbi:T9SS type A sorting domain-containing protein [bacterium SCSIO 12741]|nr:T9SS type A sorting domain-containing protein [bacterium SCSIO 12741]